MTLKSHRKDPNAFKLNARTHTHTQRKKFKLKINNGGGEEEEESQMFSDLTQNVF